MTPDEHRDAGANDRDGGESEQTTLPNTSTSLAPPGDTDKYPEDPEEQDRWVTLRMQELARTTALSESERAVVAYCEMGWTSSYIARRLDLQQRRVKALLEGIADEYGPQAVWTKPACERGDLRPLDDRGADPADES